MHLDPSAVVYTDKIHLLFECVRGSLDKQQGTSRGVGALGGSEHSLFFHALGQNYACVGWAGNMMKICTLPGNQVRPRDVFWLLKAPV